MSIKKPNQEIVNAVFQLLEEEKDHVPARYVESVVAAMGHWLENKKRGLEYMAYLLQLDSVKGSREKKYTALDLYGRLTKDINPENIVFLRGCVVGGEPVPVGQIKIEEIEPDHCEECGSSSICIENVTNPHTGRIDSWCQYCKASSGLFPIDDIGCGACGHVECCWHPVNIDTPPFDKIV